MFAKNAVRSIVLFAGVLVLAFSTPVDVKTIRNTLYMAAIDAYIENYMASKNSSSIGA